jgi:hypothetical protein
MALQTDRSIPIDWSVGAGSAFLRRPPPICWLCKILSCHCWEHQCLVWSIGGCLKKSWTLWHYRSIDPSWSIGLWEPDQHSWGVHPPSVDCARFFRVIVESTNALFRALVDASKRAELYGTTDRSIDPDRLVCRSRISILEALPTLPTTLSALG